MMFVNRSDQWVWQVTLCCWILVLVECTCDDVCQQKWSVSVTVTLCCWILVLVECTCDDVCQQKWSVSCTRIWVQRPSPTPDCVSCSLTLHTSMKLCLMCCSFLDRLISCSSKVAVMNLSVCYFSLLLLWAFFALTVTWCACLPFIVVVETSLDWSHIYWHWHLVKCQFYWFFCISVYGVISTLCIL